MTTLILQSAGSAIGGLVAGPLGAFIGGSLGSVLGQTIDRSLFSDGATGNFREGPRLTELAGITSTEGQPIPRVYGRVRLGGTLIWATRFQEHVTQEDSGGKGGGGPQVTTRTYAYTANLAIGLCEGPIGYVRRIWANGRLIDHTMMTMRIYRGGMDQAPDPLIVAKEGAENAPAYRGLAYIVFEGLPLADFGNRVPQFSFEIVRPIGGPRESIRAINLIPGAGEFVYDPHSITTSDASSATAHLNRHDLSSVSDFIASLDQLEALCPALTTIQLVISWFGDDLRAGRCKIEPRVESTHANTIETSWVVSGLGRSDARVVTYIEGKAAFGGTPSDASILRAIQEIKSRGYKVILYPFVMMDIGPDINLPDPHGSGGQQAAFPWRGRITCDPAPGLPGSPAGTSKAADEVDHFFGNAKPENFIADGETIRYQGDVEWSWRRLILHYARLGQLAGGVDGLIIGSELRDLTFVESQAGIFPAVEALKKLAADAKTILGGSAFVTYAADWTEYGARIMPSGALRFPLDSLWSSPSIDMIGIDSYFPLSDWREGRDHQDAQQARSIYDKDYLRSRLRAGEAFDWYYQSPSDRAKGLRTPITNGAYGEAWIYRTKDLTSWWQNSHYERVDNVKLPQATAWKPESKPIWLTEFGCPAVDRGSNAPHVFPDPKSSENAKPYFSRGGRDDLIQSRLIEAYQTYFDPTDPQFIDSQNPLSRVYGGRMVQLDHLALWAFDARPFPAFPSMANIWSDSENYLTGHWVNGRLEACPLDALIRAILSDFSIDECEIAVDGFLDGYVISSPGSARSALEPLASLYHFDCIANDDLRFTSIDPRVVTDIGLTDCILNKAGAPVSVIRSQSNELPCEVRLGFSDGEADYRSAVAVSRRLAVPSQREVTSAPMVVTTRGEAERLANRVLYQAWSQRDHASLSVRPGLVALEAGDLIRFEDLGHGGIWRILKLTDRGLAIDIEAQAVSLDGLDLPATYRGIKTTATLDLAGRPNFAVLDLPVVKSDTPVLQALAASVDPWPGALSIWRSSDGADWRLYGSMTRPSKMGVTLSELPSGPTSCWDLTNSLLVQFGSVVISSAGDDAALSGESILAIEGETGGWEVIGFALAELTASSTWRLSRLLRGLGSSEGLASRRVAAGARVIILDQSLLPLSQDPDDVGKHYFWRITPAGVDYMHPMAAAFDSIIGNSALMPLPPVHAKIFRVESGISIQFLRRGRIRADSWVPPDIPLDQSSEAYEIEILKGNLVVRLLTTSKTTALYAASDELADFSTRQSRLDFRIYQLGDGVGRGQPAQFSLTIQ